MSVNATPAVPKWVGNTLQWRVNNHAQAVFSIDPTTGNPVNNAPGPNQSTTAATLAQAYKTVAASGTPEALVGVETLVESVIITARKNRTTANTGTVWIGFSATNDTQLRALDPGESITYTAPDGKKLDLHAFYVDVATNGDGVLYESGN